MSTSVELSASGRGVAQEDFIMATARAMLERRRSSRVRISIPLSVVRSEASQSNNTPAEAISISRYGALLRVPFLPPVGSRIELLHARSQEVREFRVISAKSPKVPGSFELGIEILHPAQNFWGVQLPEDRCSA